MIKYRPHRGLLDDAMAEMKTFNTLDEMFEYIVQDCYGYLCKEDLSVSEDFGKDSRIDWKETRHVCTSRFGAAVYNVPICIGMCSIEDIINKERDTDWLDNCPFCGGEAYYHYDDDNLKVEDMSSQMKPLHFILCKDCPALICGKTKEIAYAKWNRRIYEPDNRTT